MYSNQTNYRAEGHLHLIKNVKRGDYFGLIGHFWSGEHGMLTVTREKG